MRCIMSLMFVVLAAFTSLSAILGARDGEPNIGGWRNPYVTSGLCGMWDGEWNAGPGVHVANATRLANLAATGTKYDAIPISGNIAASRVGQNYVSFTWNAAPCQSLFVKNSFIANEMKGEFTVEVAFLPSSNWKKNYSGIVGNHGGQRNGTKGIIFGQMEGDYISWGFWDQNVMIWKPRASTLSLVDSSMSIVCSKAGGVAKVFRAGILQASMQVDIVPLNITRPFMIGSAFDDGTDSYPEGNLQRVFDGRIYNVRVYSRALSDSEVVSNYQVDVRRFGVR